jgi:hypothetical protein
MINLPVSFKEKVKLPTSADGTGYPYRISASDLDRNFAYAALDAPDGWIEEVSAGEYTGRKLKIPDWFQNFPHPPSEEGLFFHTASGGQLSWVQYQEKEVSVCEGNYATTGTILFKPSE